MTKPLPQPANSRERSLFGDLEAVRARHGAAMRPDLARRVRVLGMIGAGLALLVYGFIDLGFTFERIWNGLGRLGSFVPLMFPPSYGTTDKLWVYLDALGETLAIALLGTLLAAIIAFPISFFGARNVMGQRIIHFMSRRMFDGIRAIDPLIWALVWVNVVGLGPFAGILAIMTSDIGSFAKLYSEAIEAADKKPVEGVAASGGSRVQGIRFGIVPQVLPVMLSQVLYYFESNTRSATIIGIVGAGGIGLHLTEQIRTLEWQHVAFLVLMILVTVAIIDQISSRLRFALIGRQPRDQ